MEVFLDFTWALLATSPFIIGLVVAILSFRDSQFPIYITKYLVAVTPAIIISNVVRSILGWSKLEKSFLELALIIFGIVLVKQMFEVKRPRISNKSSSQS